MSLDNFTLAYVECALWSTSVDEAYAAEHAERDLHSDTSLDRAGFTPEDIAPEALASIVADCASFREAAGELLSDWSDGQAGHDLWLTRNRHGAGFWDRGLPHGEELSAIARAYGESDLYIGDDGQLYL
jgi:hypothetical protein